MSSNLPVFAVSSIFFLEFTVVVHISEIHFFSSNRQFSKTPRFFNEISVLTKIFIFRQKTFFVENVGRWDNNQAN